MITVLGLAVICLSCHALRSSGRKAKRYSMARGGGAVEISRCAFVLLSMPQGDGGAINFFARSPRPDSSDLSVRLCCFERCSADAGGAVWFRGCSFQVLQSVSEGCCARSRGGFASADSAARLNATGITKTEAGGSGSLCLSGDASAMLSHHNSTASFVRERNIALSYRHNVRCLKMVAQSLERENAISLCQENFVRHRER
jgi:hypothetical protein